MIRVTKAARVLMFSERNHRTKRFWEDVNQHGFGDGALIIETLECRSVPVCPLCLAAAPDEEPKGGAGLVVCAACCHPFVALRFLGGAEIYQWHTFPWPP